MINYNNTTDHTILFRLTKLVPDSGPVISKHDSHKRKAYRVRFQFYVQLEMVI